jgi:hypothetical protein
MGGRGRALGALFACALLTACDGELAPSDAALHDGGVDAGATDAGTPILDAEIPEDAGRLGRVVYPLDRRHSPLTADLAENLQAIRERGPDLQDDVFAKVGASATQSGHFMHCFAGTRVDLDGRVALQTTIDHFLAGDADGTSPFERESVTAIAGWHAGRALTETDPPPIEVEVETILPGYAIVMYGTNDVYIVSAETYGQNMLDLTDFLLDRGVVPVLSTFMPNDRDPEQDALVPLYNLVLRGIAQARGTPFVDYHRELVVLPDHGLSSDLIHPSTYRIGSVFAPCVFTAEGLGYGYNIRNLVTIESFDRVRRVVEGEAAPDEDVVRMAGDGSPAAPFEIASLPFTDVRDTFFSPHRRLSSYSGCDATQDESGPELLYRLVLDSPTTVRAMVVSRRGVDVDLHLLDESASEAGCIARAHREITMSLLAGTYHFALDSFTSSAGEQAGEYLFLVMED